MNDDEFDHMLRAQHEAFISEIMATAPRPRPVIIRAKRTPFLARLQWYLRPRLAALVLVACAIGAVLVASNRSETPPGSSYVGDAVASGGSVTLFWHAPAGGQEAVNYTVTADGVPTKTVTGTQTVFSGLENGKTYQFRVTANLHSGSVPVPVLARAGQVPTVDILDTSVLSSTSVSLLLKVNDHDGGPVTCRVLVNDETTMVTPCSGTQTVVVDGLIPALTYTLSVRASNAVGDSPLDTRTTARIPVADIVVSRGPQTPSTVCADANCAFVNVSIRGAAPDSSMIVQCLSSPGGMFFNYLTKTNHEGNSDSAVCFFGSPGGMVWVQVDGWRSNHLVW